MGGAREICCSDFSDTDGNQDISNLNLVELSGPVTKRTKRVSFGFTFIAALNARRGFQFPSDPPSEGGSPGVVRSRCPTPATFWPASLATGPAGLPQRGVSAGFRNANLLALRRANGRASGEPSARRAGEAGSASLPTFLREQESRSPAGARLGADLGTKLDSRRWRYGDSKGVVRQARHEQAAGQRIPGNIPFIPRIIFCMPPLENCFIIFCVCSN